MNHLDLGSTMDKNTHITLVHYALQFSSVQLSGIGVTFGT